MSEGQKEPASATPTPSRPPLELSQQDHTAFVTLLFEHAAEAANEASAAEPKRRAEKAKLAMGRLSRAFQSMQIAKSAIAPKAMLGAVDAAFRAFEGLSKNLESTPDTVADASQVHSQAMTLVAIFGVHGWKAPDVAAVMDDPARQALQDASTLTTAEKANLGMLQIRAARQQILGAWSQITAEETGAPLLRTAEHLRHAMVLLNDPNLAASMDAVRSELEVTNEVLSRLFIHFEQNRSADLGELRGIADGGDRLQELTGNTTRWTARLPQREAAPTNAPAKDESPAAKEKQQNARPSAAPPVHRGTPQTFVKKIELRDTNYRDRSLGHLELRVDALRTSDGEVYATNAVVLERLVSDAQRVLKIAYEKVITPMLDESTGVSYVDVAFAIKVLGPGETSSVGGGISLKGSAGKNDGPKGEVGVTGTISQSTSTQVSATINRTYRIEGTAPYLRYEFDPKTYAMKTSESQLKLRELEEQHHDIVDVEVDSDMVWEADWDVNSHDA